MFRVGSGVGFRVWGLGHGLRPWGGGGGGGGVIWYILLVPCKGLSCLTV